MAYVKTQWKDRVTQYMNRYTMTENADGTITLTPVPGTVTETGTPINADNLNNVEDELEMLDNAIGKLIIGGTTYPVVVDTEPAAGRITIIL